MSVYTEIIGATSFKRKKYKLTSEEAGVYVISVSNETKQLLIDNAEFSQVVELNDPEFVRAIKQKTNLRGWRIAIELNNHTTILVGQIIGVAWQQVGNAEQTLATCLLSNKSYVILTITNEDNSLSATLSSSGAVGGGGEWNILDLNDVESPLSDENYELALANNTIIIYQNDLYFKNEETENYICYAKTSYASNGLYAHNIVITKSNKAFTISDRDYLVNPTFDGSENVLLGAEVGTALYKVNYNTLASEYSASSTYEVGDIVVYLGKLYVCNTQISVAEEWTSGHWTETNIVSSVLGLLNTGI